MSTEGSATAVEIDTCGRISIVVMVLQSLSLAGGDIDTGDRIVSVYCVFLVSCYR